jgi:hypothetical protein
MTNANDTINAVVQTSIGPYGGDRMECTDGGLTKREYFASMAMQGLMVQAIPGGHNRNDSLNNAERAKFAVDMADALIDALNKTNYYENK